MRSNLSAAMLGPGHEKVITDGEVQHSTKVVGSTLQSEGKTFPFNPLPNSHDQYRYDSPNQKSFHVKCTVQEWAMERIES